MSTSAEQIADLIQAGNRWKDQADALLADRLAHQQAYQALSSNLKGVVSNLMTFSGTVDPDDPAPTNEDGGTFNTIKELIVASPRGSYCQANLVAGKVFDLDSDVPMFNRTVHLLKSGVGDNPIIKPLAYVSTDDQNFLYSFTGYGNVLFLNEVDVDLSAAKADVALPWSTTRRCLVTYRFGLPQTLGAFSGTFTGSGGAHLINGSAGATVHLGLYSCTLDGDIFGVSSVNVATIAHGNVTLLNGALLNNGGTLGVHLLKN